MAKLRIYELSKELGVDNKDIMVELEKAGIPVKSPSCSLEDDQIKMIKVVLGKTSAKDKFVQEKPEVVFLSVKHSNRPAPSIREDSDDDGADDDMPFVPPAAKKVVKHVAPKVEDAPRPQAVEAAAESSSDHASAAPPVPPVVSGEEKHAPVTAVSSAAVVETKHEVVSIEKDSVSSPSSEPAVQATVAPAAPADAAPVQAAASAQVTAPVVSTAQPAVSTTPEAPKETPATTTPAVPAAQQADDRQTSAPTAPRPTTEQRPNQQQRDTRPGQPARPDNRPPRPAPRPSQGQDLHPDYREGGIHHRPSPSQRTSAPARTGQDLHPAYRQGGQPQRTAQPQGADTRPGTPARPDNRPGTPRPDTRPGQSPRPDARSDARPDSRPDSRAGQPGRPDARPQQQRPAPANHGDRQMTAEQKEKARKAQAKAPKPIRTEIVMDFDGVERVPVISAKLKGMLQPVKKAKPATAAEEAARKDPNRKWQDSKGGKNKKGGKFRSMAPAKSEEPGTVARKKAIRITEGISIKDFAEKLGAKSGDIIKKLFEMGMMATINQAIDSDAAVLIAEGFGLKIEVTPITDEEAFCEEVVESDTDLRPRPPVVTIMGHVDHGKTSLLDAVRKTNVTSGEAGGITQHIGAYMVHINNKDITFLDTPGHEAFTAMRARGAQVTDIVVLVVAADDGVRPQTIEAINHSKAANVPIIVAVNKMDKPEADLEKVKRELADHGLVPEEWGGQTIFAPVSAKKQIGLEGLLEMILLQAEVMELKANPNKLGRGTIVEAKLDKGRGPVATVLVSSGTIHPGDVFVTGQFFGRIRMLLNDKGKKVKEAGPAMPVEVIGLSGVPGAGDSFVVMEDEKKARQVAQSRMQKQREVELSLHKRVTLDDLFAQIQQGAVKELNIIIKADVQGSAEAVSESLIKLSTEAVKLNVIHASVGAITESDIMLAAASNAIIIGFNIRPEPKAAALAEAEGVDLRMYNIIYNAIDEVRMAMEGLLEPTFKEKVLGRAEVRQTFSVPKIGMIAGSYIIDGTITRACAGVRVLRDNIVIFTGKLSSLKRFKDDVKEVATGYECGIGVENFNDLKVGDIIEAYDIEKFASKL